MVFSFYGAEHAANTKIVIRTAATVAIVIRWKKREDIVRVTIALDELVRFLISPLPFVFGRYAYSRGQLFIRVNPVLI